MNYDEEYGDEVYNLYTNIMSPSPALSQEEVLHAIPPVKDSRLAKTVTRIKVALEGMWSVALLDSGSCANIINERSLEELKQQRCFNVEDYPITPFTKTLYSANNKPIPMSGVVRLTVEVGGLQTHKVPFLISQDTFSDELCLGLPYIKLFEGVLFTRNTVKFIKPEGGSKVRALQAGATEATAELLPDCYQVHPKRYRIFTKKTTIIPAMTGRQVEVVAPCVQDVPPAELIPDYWFDPHPGLSANLGLAALSSVVRKDALLALPVTNPSGFDVILKPGEEIGIVMTIWNEPVYSREYLNSLRVGRDLTKPLKIDNGVTFEQRIQFLDKNLNLDSGDLTQAQKEDLRSILYEYADIISTGDTDIGRTHLAEHVINTGSAKPIFQKPYRVEFKNREVIEREIEKMLSIDLIEPCKSPWASPVVLIPKKDGSTRFCIDFRKINKVTVRDAFPLPRIDDIIPLLGKKNYFVGLDMACGYWQVPVSEEMESKNKTAFTCHVGTFRFRYMPFGGVNCPATFQRLMQQVLAGQYNKTVFCYLDDILVTGTTWKELMAELRVVFQKLREGHLKLKLKKCEFGKTKIGYLGHMIDHDGYSPKPERVKVIKAIEPPTTVGECRRLIGLFGFYSKFIPRYSDYMRPIHKLLKIQSLGEWTAECQKSLDLLKEALANAPVLAFPDFAKPFKLYCDASSEAMGSVLAQVQDDELEHPLGYYSRTLTVTERKYSNTEREILSVCASLKHFYPILYGRQVVVYTDHQAAVQLYNQIEPAKRAAVFQQKFQGEIDWTLEHIRGKENVVADCLSRFPTFKESQDKLKVNHTPVMVITRSHHDTQAEPDVDKPKYVEKEREETEEDITAPPRWEEECKREQRKDPQLEMYLKFLEHGTLPRSVVQQKKLRKNIKHYFLDDNDVLKYDDLKDEENSVKTIVPKSLQIRLLKLYHGPASSGHPGRDRLYEKVKRHFYWYGMRPTIFNFLQNCMKCKQFKSQGTTKGPLNPIIANQQWDTLNVDICGPFPTSRRGNRYIVGFIDACTRFAVAFPVVEATATEVARLYLEEVCYRYGPAARLISDQGTQFKAKITNEILRLMKTYHDYSDIYHPETNGKIERFWGTLKDEIRIYTNEDGDDWDEAIPAIVYAYNCSLSRPTQFSPHEALFGRKPRLPFECMMFPSAKETRNFSEFTKDKIKVMKNVLKTLRKNNEKYGEKLKIQHDKNVRREEFKAGDQVLVRDFKRINLLDAKFDPGPYVLLWVSENGASAVVARSEDHFQSWKISTQDLKKAPQEVVPKKEN